MFISINPSNTSSQSGADYYDDFDAIAVEYDLDGYSGSTLTSTNGNLQVEGYQHAYADLERVLPSPVSRIETKIITSDSNRGSSYGSGIGTHWNATEPVMLNLAKIRSKS